MTQQNLEEREKIAQLKARYFRLMDQKRWDEWKEVFTEDVVAVYHGVPGSSRREGLTELRCEGRADLVAKVGGFLSKGISIHHGHMPELELTSATTATGIWAMVDYLLFPHFTLTGYGHYEEGYIKEGSTWKIKKILLTRLHCDLIWAPHVGVTT
ncbi:MAG: nuclear transport factor 2 family protein [Candidatus Binatia bacterium]